MENKEKKIKEIKIRDVIYVVGRYMWRECDKSS